MGITAGGTGVTRTLILRRRIRCGEASLHRSHFVHFRGFFRRNGCGVRDESVKNLQGSPLRQSFYLGDGRFHRSSTFSAFLCVILSYTSCEMSPAARRSFR